MPEGEIYEVSGMKSFKTIKKVPEYMRLRKAFEKEYKMNPKYQSCTFEETVIDCNKLCL